MTRGRERKDQIKRAFHTKATIAALATVWMAVTPGSAWGQSSWPGYPNNSAIAVTSGGNVGIGTANPQTILHAVTGGLTQVTAESTAPTAFAQFRIKSDARAYQLSMGGSGTSTWANSFYIFDESASAARLFINPQGNIGIGTTSPQSKLAVNGNITAKDVMVTNTGWSDYVFRPGYRLRPLREVSAYIQANGRLPDIPSEAEVKEKGVSVGEMQAKLLAKVEELTLHMIEADDRNHRLERQNRELRDRIARLEQTAASGARPAATK